MANNEHYVPLPFGLTIQQSDIEGLGLFATQKIEKDTELGMTHVLVDNEWIRTPLGGFYNHNVDDPNCKSVLREERKYLVTLRDIEPGEELTSTYNMYDPSNTA